MQLLQCLVTRAKRSAPKPTQSSALSSGFVAEPATLSAVVMDAAGMSSLSAAPLIAVPVVHTAVQGGAVLPFLVDLPGKSQSHHRGETK